MKNKPDPWKQYLDASWLLQKEGNKVKSRNRFKKMSDEDLYNSLSSDLNSGVTHKTIEDYNKNHAEFLEILSFIESFKKIDIQQLFNVLCTETAKYNKWFTLCIEFCLQRGAKVYAHNIKSRLFQVDDAKVEDQIISFLLNKLAQDDPDKDYFVLEIIKSYNRPSGPYSRPVIYTKNPMEFCDILKSLVKNNPEYRTPLVYDAITRELLDSPIKTEALAFFNMQQPLFSEDQKFDLDSLGFKEEIIDASHHYEIALSREENDHKILVYPTILGIRVECVEKTEYDGYRSPYLICESGTMTNVFEAITEYQNDTVVKKHSVLKVIKQA